MLPATVVKAIASFVPSLPAKLILVVALGTSIVYVVSESAGHVTVLTSMAVTCPVAFEVTEATKGTLAPAAGDTADVVSDRVVLS